MTQTPNATEPTVMIVDDTPANLMLLELILRGQGHRVLSFPSGALALRAARENPPDLILLDVLMPGMDGFAVCHALKADERLREIPVLFVSALGDTDTKVRAFEEGGADYITKPFQEPEVVARVATHLKMSRQRIELQEQHALAERRYAQLREVEAMRDQLVHMMVHDLRSPMSGILLAAELIELESRHCLSRNCNRAALQIMRTGNSLCGMINDVLDISRMEASQLPVNPERTDVVQLANHALSKLGLAAADINRILMAGIGVATADAHCDAKLTTRVMENLVGNALKFASGDGVRVLFDAQPEWVRISVRDNGPGIPDELKARIFEKFSQGDALRKSGRKGNGLGLFFCKLAVEAQGGQIGLESVEGQGSTFWFTLPARAPQA